MVAHNIVVQIVQAGAAFASSKQYLVGKGMPGFKRYEDAMRLQFTPTTTMTNGEHS
jgi:hypothetical protein